MLDLSAFFDDARLSRPLRKRLRWTLLRLAHDPAASLPKALGVAGYKGLLRALTNGGLEDVSLHDLGYAATRRLLVGGELVLSLEDTTELCFGGSTGRKGLPRLNTHTTGFLLHTSLLVRPGPVPQVLGVGDLLPVLRSDRPKAKQTAAQRYLSPDKESLRWQATVERVEARFGGHATLVHVRDREGDDYAQLSAMQTQGQRFIQRQRQPRCVQEADHGARGRRKTDELFVGLEGHIEREVTLASRAQGRRDPRPPSWKRLHPARVARLATLRVVAQRIELRRPRYVPAHRPDRLAVNVVRVWEPNPPLGHEAIEWYLETTEPIDTLEQVLFVVDGYRARWLVEEFFKALKTGCTFETLQAETTERLIELLGLYAPVAANLLALRTLAQHVPDAPAETVLSPAQLQALGTARNFGTMTARHAPTPPTSAEEALHLVAKLGGHLGKRGAAGWQVLMRGMLTLHERTVGYSAREGFAFAHASKKTVPS